MKHELDVEGVRGFYAPTYSDLLTTPREFFLGHEGYDHRYGGDNHDGEEAPYRPPFVGGEAFFWMAGRNVATRENILFDSEPEKEPGDCVQPDNLLGFLGVELSFDSRDIAYAYLSGGVDEVIRTFAEANWKTGEGRLTREATLVFCNALRKALASVVGNGSEPMPEISVENERFIINRARGDRDRQPSWWYNRLGAAIYGKDYFEKVLAKRPEKVRYAA
jgi:hypothetical protein